MMGQRIRRRTWMVSLMGSLLLAGAPATAGPAPIKLGVTLALEGTAAEYGQSNLRGIQIAVDEINAAGGLHGRPVQLVVEDTRGEPSQAVAALKKLAADPEILAVIGPVRSPELLAQSPVADQLRIVLMSPGSVLLWPGPFNPWTFRSTMPDYVGVPPLVREVTKAYGVKTAGMLYAIDDDWSVGSMEQFRKAAEANRVRLVAVEGFRTNDTDFSAQLTKIVPHRPDVVFLPVLARDAALIMNQARRLGLTSRFVGLSAFNDPHILQVAAKEAEGSIFATPFDPNSSRPKVQRFVQTYRSKYGQDVPLYAAYGYDAMVAIAYAIERAGPNVTRDSLRAALSTASGIEGVTGVFGYKGSGDAVKDVVNFLQIKGGHYAKWP